MAQSKGVAPRANFGTPTQEAKLSSETSSDVFGLLSQTIHPSPTIRWILPAQLRSKRHKDLAFVGETFVQLREFLPNGHLQDVTAKIDLGAPILAAKVISSASEHTPILDQIIKQEQDEFSGIDGIDETHSLPPQILVISTGTSEMIFLFVKDYGIGNAQFVFAKKMLLADVSLPQRYCKHLAVDHE